MICAIYSSRVLPATTFLYWFWLETINEVAVMCITWSDVIWKYYDSRIFYQFSCITVIVIFFRSTCWNLHDDNYYRIHRITLKKEKNGNKYQQVIVKFRIFLSRKQVYKAIKRKVKISVILDLITPFGSSQSSLWES